MPQLPSGLSTRPESFAPSGESNLRLQRAIESLNLNLDDELHRYRQNRAGQGTVPVTPARLQLRTNRKPIDLIALKTATGSPAAVATAAAATAAAAAPSSSPKDPLQEILGQSSAPSSQAYPPQATVNQVRLSHGGTLTTYRPIPDKYLESTEALLGSLPRDSQPPEDTVYAPSLVDRLTTPMGMGALLLLLVGSASFGYLVTSPQAVSHLTDNSIARRLRGEAAPTDAASTDPGLGAETDTGFQPMGPDLSEKEFTSLDLSSISTLPSEDQTPVGQGLASDGQSSPLASDRPGAIVPPQARPGTPAAARTDVNSAVLRAEIVSSPGAAASRPQPAATAAPRAATPAPAAPRQAQPVAPPAPIARPPQPLALNRAPAQAPSTPPAAVAPPAPITQAPPQAAPTYYVVTNYSGSQSLESARSAVSDAYVTGGRIQMGAFSQESSARNLVQQLQGQGISAQVITP